jgi:hypothetical protein
MRPQELEHLECLASLSLQPAERRRLLQDLEAMIELAARLQLTVADSPAPPDDTDAAGSASDPSVPLLRFDPDLVHANGQGWSAPFFTVPDLDRRRDRESS